MWCESLGVNKTVSMQLILQVETCQIKALTLPQSQAASGCSETAAACWQWSLTSVSTWPSQSCSATQGILRRPAVSLHQGKKVRTGRLCLWCLCACFGCQFSFLFQECALQSHWTQVCEWGSCTDEVSALRGKRDFFLRFHCHTMIEKIANEDTSLLHVITEQRRWFGVIGGIMAEHLFFVQFYRQKRVLFPPTVWEG